MWHDMLLVAYLSYLYQASSYGKGNNIEINLTNNNDDVVAFPYPALSPPINVIDDCDI